MQKKLSILYKKLGFILINNWDGYLIFSRDGIGIHLWLANEPKVPEQTGCYVHVREIDNLYAEYKQQAIHSSEWQARDQTLENKTVQRPG